MPKISFKSFRNTSWSMVSKAALRSRRTKTAHWRLSRAHIISYQQIIGDVSNCSLCAIVESVGWLEGLVKIIFRQMIIYLLNNYMFNKFAKEREIGYLAVIYQIFLDFLSGAVTMASFRVWGKFQEKFVYNVADCRQKHRKHTLE